jgi:hypothetical protein
MMVEQEKAQFSPVTITLQSQWEVDVFTEYLERNTKTNTAGKWIDDLYCNMQRFRLKGGYLND